MKNICRPFILYNDFLPPKEDIHEGWQYLSFGYNDGVSVGENLFNENECTLQVMWKYYVQNHTSSLDGSFSSQIIFGLRYEKEDAVIHDSDFWDKDVQKEYPFLFVSLIQIEKSTDQNDKYNIENRENLERYFNGSSQKKAIAYLTFDGSDLSLILLCKRYYDGAEVINSMRRMDNKQLSNRNWGKITYSFTIGAVFKKFLNDEALVEKVEGKITHAYIYIIEKQPGGSENIYGMIEESLAGLEEKCIEARENILGCNDEMILLKNIPWKRFLAFYRDKTGILNHSHENYRNNLIGVTTIIGESQDNHYRAEETKIDDNLNSLCAHMRDRCN